ncbi:putative Ribosomal protein S19e [Leishmania utingensis]|uniref:Ribosomal protein S19e n=2 Tax=Viannia TaxID=37616 RepID=A0AAW3AYI0_9TRYP
MHRSAHTLVCLVYLLQPHLHDDSISTLFTPTLARAGPRRQCFPSARTPLNTPLSPFSKRACTAASYPSMAALKNKIRRIGKRKGATLKDVSAWRWIKTAARHFKQEGKIFVPNCTELIKSSHGRERAPQNPDWYYVRCAAVLRAIYLRPGVGYGGLSKRFGNKKNYGSRPEHTVNSSTGPLHWACKSLTKLGLVEPGAQSGQRLTRKGHKFADSLAFQVQIRKFGQSKV